MYTLSLSCNSGRHKETSIKERVFNQNRRHTYIHTSIRQQAQKKYSKFLIVKPDNNTTADASEYLRSIFKTIINDEGRLCCFQCVFIYLLLEWILQEEEEEERLKEIYMKSLINS